MNSRHIHSTEWTSACTDLTHATPSDRYLPKCRRPGGGRKNGIDQKRLQPSTASAGIGPLSGRSRINAPTFYADQPPPD